MLTSLHLENFKAFGKQAIIPLAPITLIFGQNSSGKSSILQTLNLLKQTVESRDPNVVLLPRTEHGYVDLGSFREMLFDHDTKRTLKIKVNFDLSLFRPLQRQWNDQVTTQEKGFELQYGSRSSENSIKLKHIKIFHYNIDSNNPIISFTGQDIHGLTEDESVLFMTERDKFYFNSEKDFAQYFAQHKRIPLLMRCTQVTRSKRIWREFFDTVTGKHRGWGLSSIEEYLSQEERAFFHHFSQSQGDIDTFIDWMCERLLDSPTVTNLLSSSSSAYRYDSSDPYFDPFERFRERFLPIRRLGENTIQKMSQDISILLEKLYPLSPFRKSPSRWYIHSGITPSDVGLEGEMLPDLLHRDKDLLERANVWLDELDIGYKMVVTPITATADLFEVRLQDLRRSNHETTVNLLDVGYGISQLLPFVVQCLLADERIISIEQPETHIHPRLQADLGDLLIESAKRRNQLLIETHSEHLVLRLMRRVREGVLDKNNVSILYVTKGEEGSSVQPLRLDEDGDFIDDWPDGFFPERLNELV